jgi:hypothetical protein
MRKEIIDAFFNKTNVEPWVHHLYNSLIEDAVFSANNSKKARKAPPKSVVENIQFGTYIVFNNGDDDNHKDIVIAHVSDEKPQNRVSASIAIEDLKKSIPDEINKEKINKDTIFMVDKQESKMSFIATFIESSLEKANLYNRPVYIGKKETATFVLSTFIDEFIIEHPMSIIKEANSDKYGIAHSDIYFISDADSGEVISIWSTAYGMIIELKEGDTLENIIYNDSLTSIINESIHKINTNFNNGLPIQPTENGNEILH